MKRKSFIIVVLVCGGVLWWNVVEIQRVRHSKDESQLLKVPKEIHLPELNWEWFNEVNVEVEEGQCRLISLPKELEALDGKEVVVSGPSFACGDDIVEHETGYTIHSFVLVPYFGMIDCCVGNPIPYFQWTIVVKKLRVPWQIYHKGIIDPGVVVRGRLRIDRKPTEEGVFLLEGAEVIDSAESDLARDRRNLCE